MAQTVAIEAHFVTRMLTADKILQLGKWLKAADYDPVYVCWDEHSGPVYQKAVMPALTLTIEKESVDVIGAAQKLVAELNTPIFHNLTKGIHVPSPTWGELIGYDDFLGTAQGYKIGGAASLKPDLVVTPVPGAESNTPEDSIFSLAMWRFCQQNHIPRLGIEGLAIQNDARLNKWPVDLLLTKNDPRNIPHVDEWAPQALRQNASLRYVMSIAQSPMLDQFVSIAEPEMRKQFGSPGVRFLYLPFHISFKAQVIAMLEALTPYLPMLHEANFKLLLSCDSAGWRRNLNERDMVRIGLQRWLDQWPGRWLLIEGVPYVMLALMADALLAPYESGLTEEAQRWGIPIIRPGQEQQVTNLACGISLTEAVAWLLNPQEEKRQEGVA